MKAYSLKEMSIGDRRSFKKTKPIKTHKSTSLTSHILFTRDIYLDIYLHVSYHLSCCLHGNCTLHLNTLSLQQNVWLNACNLAKKKTMNNVTLTLCKNMFMIERLVNVRSFNVTIYCKKKKKKVNLNEMKLWDFISACSSGKSLVIQYNNGALSH